MKKTHPAKKSSKKNRPVKQKTRSGVSAGFINIFLDKVICDSRNEGGEFDSIYMRIHGTDQTEYIHPTVNGLDSAWAIRLGQNRIPTNTNYPVGYQLYAGIIKGVGKVEVKMRVIEHDSFPNPHDIIGDFKFAILRQPGIEKFHLRILGYPGTTSKYLGKKGEYRIVQYYGDDADYKFYFRFESSD
jgi:hypothetical protein